MVYDTDRTTVQEAHDSDGGPGERERKERGATEPRRRLEDSQTIFKTSNFQVYKN